MRFSREKRIASLHEPEYKSPNGEYPNPFYDPDIAHPAVRYGGDIEAPALAGTTERRLLAKIDLRVIPFLAVLYLLAFLDRTNIANAAIYGLKTDLNLTGTKYNTALTIFFVPYILLEIPFNILMKKVRPHVWLSLCMFLFGVVTVCQGLVQNYSGLLATRFFLGVAESNMFAAAFYIIGMWYKRSQGQQRYSFFFSSTTLAGAFGGLLASAIGKMDGMKGYSGWRWIFILEGALTAVVAAIFFFFLPDFPEDAKWLTEEERAFVKHQLELDQGKAAADRKIRPRDVLNVFKDYKVFLAGFMYFGLIVPAYGYAYFAPSIIKSYGYSAIETQLHSVPPWAAAFGFSMVIAFCSDKLHHRFVFTLVPIAVSLAGFIILFTVHNNLHLQYGALFMVTSGTYAAMPVQICWATQNLAGHHRRSVGAGWIVGFGNIGGIIATYSFIAKDAPEYKPGIAVCIGFICLSAAACCAYGAACWWQNHTREKSSKDIGLTEFEETELGDMSPRYRYQL